MEPAVLMQKYVLPHANGKPSFIDVLMPVLSALMIMRPLTVE